MILETQILDIRPRNPTFENILIDLLGSCSVMCVHECILLCVFNMSVMCVDCMSTGMECVYCVCLHKVEGENLEEVRERRRKRRGKSRGGSGGRASARIPCMNGKSYKYYRISKIALTTVKHFVI